MNDFDLLSTTVVNKYAETPDVAVFELRGAQGLILPEFAPGSHIEVHLANKLVRAYSLCTASNNVGKYIIAVHKSPTSRGGSRVMHEDVSIGDVLKISTPRNFFPLVSDCGHSVLVAAGIGITPILSMAEHLTLSKASFELHYVTRSRGKAAFLNQIENSNLADFSRLYFSEEGLEGSISTEMINPGSLIPPPHQNDNLYVCGPAAFMDAVMVSARNIGWMKEQLHQEHFQATISACNTASFEVKLAKTGKIVTVRPNESVVQALATIGVEIPTSCEQGVCGTCLTKVLDGEPEHLDLFLTPEEQAQNNQFLPCCSRSKTASLTLDL